MMGYSVLGLGWTLQAETSDWVVVFDANRGYQSQHRRAIEHHWNTVYHPFQASF